MALPQIEIKSITPTEASIEVDGVAVGTITVALQEQETIEGVDNALIVLGDCENVQDSSHHGFVFSVVKGLPELAAAPELEEDPAITEPEGE
jgi:hypothetical protein